MSLENPDDNAQPTSSSTIDLHIFDIGDDMLFEVLHWLDAESLGKIDQVCKKFSEMSRQDSLWEPLYNNLLTRSCRSKRKHKSSKKTYRQLYLCNPSYRYLTEFMHVHSIFDWKDKVKAERMRSFTTPYKLRDRSSIGYCLQQSAAVGKALMRKTLLCAAQYRLRVAFALLIAYLVLSLCNYFLFRMFPLLPASYGDPQWQLPSLFSVTTIFLFVSFCVCCYCVNASVRDLYERMRTTRSTAKHKNLQEILDSVSHKILDISEKQYPHDRWILLHLILWEFCMAVSLCVVSPKMTLPLAAMCALYSTFGVAGLTMAAIGLGYLQIFSFFFFKNTTYQMSSRNATIAVGLAAIIVGCMGVLGADPNSFSSQGLLWVQSRWFYAWDGLRILCEFKIRGWNFGIAEVFHWGFGLGCSAANIMVQYLPIPAIISSCVILSLAMVRARVPHDLTTPLCTSLVYMVSFVVFGILPPTLTPASVLQICCGLLSIAHTLRAMTLRAHNSTKYIEKFNVPLLLLSVIWLFVIFQFRTLLPAMQIVISFGRWLIWFGFIPETVPPGTAVSIIVASAFGGLLCTSASYQHLPDGHDIHMTVVNVLCAVAALWVGWWAVMFRVLLGVYHILHAPMIRPAWGTLFYQYVRWRQ